MTLRKIVLQILKFMLFMLVIFFTIFKTVNYDIYEFKLGAKSLLLQELTLDEMKNSNIYRTYKQINYKTNIEEINNITNRQNETIAGLLQRWDLVYGNITIWYSKDIEPKVRFKSLYFQTPQTVELSDSELIQLLECKNFEDITNILGEPAILGESYDKNGKLTESRCEWGIKAKFLIPNEYTEGFPWPSMPFKKKLKAEVRLGIYNQILEFTIKEY